MKMGVILPCFLSLSLHHQGKLEELIIDIHRIALILSSLHKVENFQVDLFGKANLSNQLAIPKSPLLINLKICLN